LNQQEQKKRAAMAAIPYIEDGIVLGIGTGSTADLFIDELAPHVGRLTAVVSSSNRTTERLERHGIRASSLADVAHIDLYVDGADEATKHRHLLKGGGGALTREKVLAGAARRFVCIVDSTKLVGQLGRFPLPIEVLPMAETFVARQLFKAKGRPVLREGVVTDNGNHILDVYDLRIANPVELETRFNQIPGVVTVGLFAHRSADVLIVGQDDGVRTIE
jgi:ribose 5-phosphate isomerase A